MSYPDPKMRGLIVTALMLALLSAGGCYRYVPASLEATPQGYDVRLIVTRDGARELGEVTSVLGAAPEVRGQVAGHEGEAILVRVPVGQRREGIHTVGLDQVISVPTAEIMSIEHREFDTVGTGAFVSATAGAAALVILGVMKAFGKLGEDEGDNGDDVLFSLLSIPIG